MSGLEKAHTEKKALQIHKSAREDNRKRFEAQLDALHNKYVKQIIAHAKTAYPKDAASREKSIGSFEATMSKLVSALHRDLDATIKLNVIKSFTDGKRALGAAFNQVDEHAITAMLVTDRTLDAVKDFSQAQREGFKQVIMDAYDKGLDENRMAKEMREFADTETYKLERIARTESNKFSNRGRIAGYKDLEDRRDTEYEYEIVDAEDDRECDLCTSIADSGPYSLDEAMKALDGGTVHCNCRCNIVRVVK